eukprot:TRINITY_DN7901_c0_g1_i15.p1 TRINITY_DN7901_c0_g1~~TRINITY_DN7901_c0_g1_i15.p1  ORF type:complete len:338 (+),score=65.45 TRINITY_DN7901_c0_g1_i15:231-1244(+)
MEDIKDSFEPMQTRSSAHLHQTKEGKERGKMPQSASPARRKACTEWADEGDARDSKNAWTEKEELEMLIAHQKFQNKWSLIAQQLSGRNNNSVKNRFYSIFRKIKNKIKRLDFDYVSRFESLEAIYILSLMKQYLFSQTPTQNQTGKRGKDYIFSLLRGLGTEEVASYQTKLQVLIGKEISLQEFRAEVASASQEQPMVDNDISDMFAYITKSHVYEKSLCILPPLHENQPSALTSEEKEFIHFQAFQSKEPMSAGSLGCCGMNYSVGSSEIFSASQAQGRNQFEDFSDLAASNRQPPKSLVLHGNLDSAFRPLPKKCQTSDTLLNYKPMRDEHELH